MCLRHRHTPAFAVEPREEGEALRVPDLLQDEQRIPAGPEVTPPDSARLARGSENLPSPSPSPAPGSQDPPCASTSFPSLPTSLPSVPASLLSVPASLSTRSEPSPSRSAPLDSRVGRFTSRGEPLGCPERLPERAQVAPSREGKGSRRLRSHSPREGNDWGLEGSRPSDRLERPDLSRTAPNPQVVARIARGDTRLHTEAAQLARGTAPVASRPARKPSQVSPLASPPVPAGGRGSPPASQTAPIGSAVRPIVFQEPPVRSRVVPAGSAVVPA
jgi:hypothetical protein